MKKINVIPSLPEVSINKRPYVSATEWISKPDEFSRSLVVPKKMTTKEIKEFKKKYSNIEIQYIQQRINMARNEEFFNRSSKKSQKEMIKVIKSRIKMSEGEKKALKKENFTRQARHLYNNMQSKIKKEISPIISFSGYYTDAMRKSGLPSDYIKLFGKLMSIAQRELSQDDIDSIIKMAPSMHIYYDVRKYAASKGGEKAETPYIYEWKQQLHSFYDQIIEMINEARKDNNRNKLHIDNVDKLPDRNYIHASKNYDSLGIKKGEIIGDSISDDSDNFDDKVKESDDLFENLYDLDKDSEDK